MKCSQVLKERSLRIWSLFCSSFLAGIMIALALVLITQGEQPQGFALIAIGLSLFGVAIGCLISILKENYLL